MTGDKAPPLIPLLLAALVTPVVFSTIVFWPAGRVDWLAGWLYVGVACVTMLGNLVYLQRVNPEVVVARMQIHRGTKTWDTLWAALFGPLFLGTYIVAGFDAVRCGWSAMSPWMWLPGILVWLLGNALFAWSMGVNPFFEKTVRIQTDRGQRVIDTGPYAIVRHPGYVGFFGWILSVPLMLGSWWALLPALLSVAAVVIRTTLEDRTLERELAGYREYMGRVCYRLIPGVW